ncbi:MAG: ChaN family lipoprotein, partial [Bdellovibrionales bacterium]|nr:ChaN family lipoprotein [Bdellovibrionales bacterium]
MKNLIITLCVVLAGCAGRSEWTSKHSRSHPLVGRIWDVSQNRFVDRGDLAATAVEADFLYLGEKHDNPDHHRLRSEFISELAHSGRSIALGFEQLSEEQERKLQSGGWK